MKDNFDFNSKTFKKFMRPYNKGIKGFMDKLLWNTKFIHFMGRPIGIVTKNKRYIEEVLNKNIGNKQYDFIRYGEDIGNLTEITYEDNGFTMPFWKRDINKLSSYDYLDYANKLNLDDIQIVRGVEKLKYDDTELGILSYDMLNRELIKRKSFTKSITPKIYDNFNENGKYGIHSSLTVENNSVKEICEYLGVEYSENIDTNDIISNLSYKAMIGMNLLDKNVKSFKPSNHFYKNAKEYGKPIKIYNSILKEDANISGRMLYTYSEGEGNIKNNIIDGSKTYNEGVRMGTYLAYSSNNIKNEYEIINKTNNLFKEGKLNTLIGRFHSDKIEIDGVKGNEDITSTAISQYGMSHGRNLLKANHTGQKTNGYSNPYCRVWTFHHQYSKLSDTIRPFNGDELKNSELIKYRTSNSFNKMKEFGVKGSNKLVQIAPTSKDNIKNCMFSIENLAWKGEKRGFQGYESQKGPLGGRIMWFPPYDLRFSENVNVNWNANQFIGRGESIYTYTNTERSGQLSFKLLIDHPSIINSFRKEVSTKGGDVDDVDSNEQKLLRFFAGCEILQPIKSNNDSEPKKEKVEAEKPKPIVTKTSTFNEINFYVFFPNNYSGIDDKPDSIVPPINYLINGIGANYYAPPKKENKKEPNDYKINNLVCNLSEQYNGYEMGTNGISKYNGSYLGNYDVSTKKFKEYLELGNNFLYVQKGRNNKVWGYRVDKRVNHEKLRNKNYTDNTSFKLNSTGYSGLTQVHTDAKKLVEKGTLYSFSDVFLAVNGKTNFEILNNGKYNEIKKLLDEYDVNSVDITGFASSHGYTKSNNVLGKNRAATIRRWLQYKMPSKFNGSKFNFINAKIGSELKVDSVNDFMAKVWRCVKVTIKLEKETIINVSDNTDVNVSFNDGKPITDSNNLNSINYRENQDKLDKSNWNVLNFKTEDKIDEMFNTKPSFITDMQKKLFDNQRLLNKFDNDLREKYAGQQIKIKENETYGDEYKFFEELQSFDPLLHNKLVDKIKYFDPAFHSITPEGFQSRLTFLHQCTRQGNTNGASDNGSTLRTASNLAFGRPPICVLRVGDFYNTKIIIDSLSISYDDTTWDLNDEGIGVMPMIANVNISFKFLGGSDLSGPITRLQNALSFNHYANTFTYDNRAEEIMYSNDKTGEIMDFKPNR